MQRKRILLLVVVAAVSLPAGAQVAAPTGSKAAPPRPAASSAVSVTAPDNLSPLLVQIQSAARTITADVSLLNVRKWKVANDVKNDAETKAEAIQRNLVVALPTIVAQVQASPNDFAANFKLYRNLGVLYDVVSSLAESAGAFGSKNEFESLATDLNRIDQARRALGDRLESLASAKDAEVAQLRSQVNAALTAASAPPRKIVVDDDEKKPAKKTTKKKPPATAATQTSPARPSNPQ
jgi:hypothetical protein